MNEQTGLPGCTDACGVTCTFASDPMPVLHAPLIAEIQAAVCARFGLSLMDLLSVRRTREVVRPRQIAMFLARALTQQSMPSVGRRFGDRDHTTVIHAVRAVERLARTDRAVAADIEALCEDLACATADREAAAA